MFEDFKIKVFITVAEEGNFTKAASSLGVSQPAVSQNVADLERQAGTKLFNRERGSVTLTDEGRVLLKYAQKSVALGLSADRIFISLPPKDITFKTSDEIWKHFLTPALEDFNKAHPHVSFLRTQSEEADLTIEIMPSSMLGTSANAVAKMRVSLCPLPTSAEDYAFNREKTFTFDLILRPSATFAGTPHYQILRATLTDVISL